MALKKNRSHSTWCERLAVTGCLCFVCILLQMTIWKENELFWRDIGGYPIWLREVLHFIYYPYLLFTTITLLTVSRSALGRLFHHCQFHRIWIVFLGTWILFASSLALVVTNNVINLWNGRPIHYHSSFEPNTIDTFRPPGTPN